MTRRRVVTAAVLAVLALVWGTQYLVVRVAQADLPPWRAVALRFAIVALLGQLVLLARPAAAPRGTLPLRVAMGVTQALSMGLLYSGQARLPSALVSVLMSTTPLFVVLIATRWLAEPLRARTVGASALGLLGILVSSGAGWSDGTEVAGVALVVGAALSSAVSKTLGKAVARLPLAVLLRDLGVVVSITAALASLVTEHEGPWAVGPLALGGAVYLGLVASSAANALYFIVLRDVEVSRLSYLMVVSAMVGLGSGVAIAGERLRPAAIVGVVLVLAGAALHASHLGTAAPSPGGVALRE